jgi:GH25 family lysozyme M1 (1,4-beta-N-acetylmuramidase)
MRKRPLVLLLVAALLAQSLTAAVLAADTYEAEGLSQEAQVLLDDPLYVCGSGYVEAEQFGEGVPTSHEACTPRTLTEGETLRKGIDVSQFQGTIDWEAVAASGVEFAFIRVGYRGYGSAGTLCNDNYFKTNIEGALAAGIQVGVYMFSQAITVQEGIDEAQFVLDRIGGYDITLPLIIDYEYAAVGLGRLYNAHLSKTTATAICNAFVYTVQKAGYSGATYASKNFLLDQLNPSELSCVWLAQWTANADYTGDYDFWQFSDCGVVDGIGGVVDLDFWFDDGDFGELTDWVPFTDVDPDSWSYSSIRTAYDAGLIKGTGETTFSPQEKTTRGQLAAMLYRMEGEPSVTGTTDFTDLTQDYYKNAVTWAKQQGIINGTAATKFSPEENVTRQDMLTMLYRMAGQPAVKGSLSGFADADQVSSYAVEAVKWALSEGILKGTDGNIDPLGNATREQVAAFLTRYMQR